MLHFSKNFNANTTASAFSCALQQHYYEQASNNYNYSLYTCALSTSAKLLLLGGLPTPTAFTSDCIELAAACCLLGAPGPPLPGPCTFWAEFTVDSRALGLWESLKDELRTVEF